jgi:DNA polymerase-3 subunit epsilon
LCPIALGLESGAGPCSAQPTGGCRGACVGAESSVAHLVRVGLALTRLRIPRWPYRGAVAILEQDEARIVSEYHVARDWCYLGSARDAAELEELAAVSPPPFDIDAYRILQRALRDTPSRRVIDLASP